MLGHLGAMLGPCWAILGPSWAYVGPSWAILAPCSAYVGPSWGHLGPMLALCWSDVGPFMRKTSSETTFYDFFRPSKQKLWKNPHFLTSPRCNSAPPRGPKPCKKRCFLNTTRRIHCKLQGFLSTRTPYRGSAAGAAAHITFGYHRRPPAMPRARGRRPDL